MPLHANLPHDDPDDLIRPPMVYVNENPPWEYKVLNRDLDELPGAIELNGYGIDGWELTAVISTADQVLFYFKRLGK
jgi:hypothetical protein